MKDYFSFLFFVNSWWCLILIFFLCVFVEWLLTEENEA